MGFRTNSSFDKLRTNGVRIELCGRIEGRTVLNPFALSLSKDELSFHEGARW